LTNQPLKWIGQRGRKTALCGTLERGELADNGLIYIPQLVVAPGIIAVFWSELFDL
jgi:hypothetical protein